MPSINRAFTLMVGIALAAFQRFRKNRRNVVQRVFAAFFRRGGVMSVSRRRFLAAALIFRLGRATARAVDGSTGVVGSGLSTPKASSNDFREMWIRETGGVAVSNSDAIALNMPAVAEDGAIVPVALGSRIAKTDRLVLFVERNPFPFIAAFDFAESTVPVVSLNIKMNESSAVIVLVRAGNRFYQTERHVRVVRGGCGDSPGQRATNR